LGRTPSGLLLTSYGGRVMEWKTISSLEGRYEINLLGEVRRTKDKKPMKLNSQGCYNSSWGLGYDGGKHRWGRSKNSLLDECFPFWWIRDLEDGEEVKPIRGFPGYYITNRGKLYSTKNHHCWLEGKPKPPYYYITHLYRDGKKTKQHIHTLVGRHFLPDWKEGLFILHREETLSYPEINFPENLWVGTQRDNVMDGVMKGRWNNFGRP